MIAAVLGASFALRALRSESKRSATASRKAFGQCIIGGCKVNFDGNWPRGLGAGCSRATPEVETSKCAIRQSKSMRPVQHNDTIYNRTASLDSDLFAIANTALPKAPRANHLRCNGSHRCGDEKCQADDPLSPLVGKLVALKPRVTANGLRRATPPARSYWVFSGPRHAWRAAAGTQLATPRSSHFLFLAPLPLRRELGCKAAWSPSTTA